MVPSNQQQTESQSTVAQPTQNVDASEIEKFSALASRWWDPNSEFKPLHAINPLRLEWIKALINAAAPESALANQRVIDIGCGGGILAESMAINGAEVTGIDLSEKSLTVAKLHSLESGVPVTYLKTSAEEMAADSGEVFDVVTCMEMLEHVPNPASVVQACADLVKPGGWVFFSTLNRNPKSFLFAIVGAEYVLKLLPKGTHQWDAFIKPSELAQACRSASLEIVAFKGMTYNPFTQIYKLGQDSSVNYLVAARKNAS